MIKLVYGIIQNPSGTTVAGHIQGPIVLSVGPGSYTFNGLNTATPYRNYVTAENSVGNSVVKIQQTTP